MDYDYITINDTTEWEMDNEIEIPEDEFELESARDLYEEVKDESIEDIEKWYDENVE